MKKLIVLMCLMFPILVNAATISVTGTTALSPGETTTLSLIVNSSNKIYGGQVNFALSNNDFEILINQSTTSYGTIIKTTNPMGVAVISLEKVIPAKGVLAKIKIKAKDTATVGSTTDLTLSNVILTVNNGEKNIDDKASNYTKTLTVMEPKSTNNYLASLTVEGYPITFAKETTSYAIDVPKGTTSLVVAATSEDPKATVKITGNTALKEGKNTIAVTVTAENGSKKVYNIYATLPTTPVTTGTDCDLNSLTIKGYEINFNADKTEYRVNVPNDKTAIEITSTLANTESTKVTEGPGSLAVGENVYTITVTDKNQNKKEYRVIVTRAEAEKVCEVCETCQTCETNTDDGIWKILAIILVIVTLAETIYMVTMHDRKQI